MRRERCGSRRIVEVEESVLNVENEHKKYDV